MHARANRSFAVTPREVTIAFDLADMPSDVYQQVAQRVPSRQTKKSYDSVQLQLELTVQHDRADIALVCGKTVDMMGRTGYQGFPLGAALPIIFHGTPRDESVGSGGC